MKLASLFAGIGGFDLAAHWMGWETVLQCEINPFAQQILRYYWPDATLVNDITKTDFTPYAGLIDILTGGFPCQPYSVAGQQKGTDDERHLWPHMLRAIREIRPRWVVGENVRGLVSWNGGLVFDQVQSDLEAEGYSVAPFLLPACAVNAPHRRDRIWFVAYNASYTECDSDSRTQPRGHGLQDSLAQKFGANDSTAREFSGADKRDTSRCASERHGKTTPNTNYAGFQAEKPEQQTAVLEQHGELVSGSTPNTASGVQQGYEPGERGNKGWENVQPEHGSTDTEFTGAVGENGTATDTANNGYSGQPRRSESRDERGFTAAELSARSEFSRCSDFGTTENTDSDGWDGFEREEEPKKWGQQDTGAGDNERVRAYDAETRATPDTESASSRGKLQQRQRSGGFGGRDSSAGYVADMRGEGYDWQNFPTQSPVCDGDDGLSTLLDATAVFGKPCKPAHAKPFARWRNESIKGGGNAIVPQVAYQIFQAIYEYNLMY